MTGVGEILVLVGMMAMMVSPIERTLSHRRHIQTEMFEGALKRAFPFPAPSPSIDDLVHAAERALEQEALSRGIAATAATYDRADDKSPTP